MKSSVKPTRLTLIRHDDPERAVGTLRVDSRGTVTYETEDSALKLALDALFKDGPVIKAFMGCYEDVVEPRNERYVDAIGAALPEEYYFKELLERARRLDERVRARQSA